MKLVDLTQPFKTGMPVYPGDDVPKIIYSSKEGVVNHQIITGTHAGTHIDAPLHMLDGGKKLSEIGVEKFIGPGTLIDARGKATIGSSLLDGKNIPPGQIVLVLTGQS